MWVWVWKKEVKPERQQRSREKASNTEASNSVAVPRYGSKTASLDAPRLLRYRGERWEKEN